MVAPIWRDNVQAVGRAAWGRSCGSAKLLAGTLRCLRLCWRLPWDWSDAEQLGRCPKPHKGRCPLTLQGADEKGRSPPLDPFRAIELVTLSYCVRVFIHDKKRDCPYVGQSRFGLENIYLFSSAGASVFSSPDAMAILRAAFGASACIFGRVTVRMPCSHFAVMSSSRTPSSEKRRST